MPEADIRDTLSCKIPEWRTGGPEVQSALPGPSNLCVVQSPAGLLWVCDACWVETRFRADRQENERGRGCLRRECSGTVSADERSSSAVQLSRTVPVVLSRRTGARRQHELIIGRALEASETAGPARTTARLSLVQSLQVHVGRGASRQLSEADIRRYLWRRTVQVCTDYRMQDRRTLLKEPNPCLPVEHEAAVPRLLLFQEYNTTHSLSEPLSATD